MLYLLIICMPLQPEWVEKLKKEGRLEKIVKDYLFAKEKYGIDVLPQTQLTTTLTRKVSGSGIAILVDFDDNPADTINHPPISYDSLLFSEGIYPGGSMKDFYNENSYRIFKFSGKVYPPPESGRKWLRMDKSYEYYSEYYGFLHSAELVIDAISKIDNEVDFGEFDNDGPDGIPNSGDDDGIVDAVYIVHAGPGYEEGGCGKIWSHMSWVNHTTNDPSANGGYIRIGPYSIQPEEHCSGKLIDIGVFCHEFGHILGLPDLYDYGYDSQGVGKWSLMAAGSWNGKLGSSPAHFDAWCKYKLGWIEPVVIKENAIDVKIPPVEENPVVYKLWTNGEENPEYFLVEYRKKEGFDSYLPGEGLLVYHIDEEMPNNNNQYIPEENSPGTMHYLVAIEQADGEFELERNINSGDEYDPFPGERKRNYIYGYTPYPTTRDYYEKDTKIGIFNINNEDSIIRCDIDVGRTFPYFEIVEYSIQDADGNQRIEYREVGNVFIKIKNRWGKGENVKVYLFSDNAIKVEEGEKDINTFGEEEELTVSFKIECIKQGFNTSKLIFLLKESSTGFTQKDTIKIISGWPGLMIVKDIDNEEIESFYTKVLDELNVPYEIHNSEKAISIIEKMNNRDSCIIWITGQNHSTLSFKEIELLKSFLDNGGKLFITGENIGEDIGNTDFYRVYLHAQCIKDSLKEIFLIGRDGDPVGKSKNDTIAISPKYSSSKDVIKPIDASACFYYKTGGVAGLTYDGTYKLVYFAFPFEGIGGNPKRFIQRKEIMKRILMFFGYRNLGIKERLTRVKNTKNTEMKIYDVTGRLVAKYTNERIKTLSPGVYFIFAKEKGKIKHQKVIIIR